MSTCVVIPSIGASAHLESVVAAALASPVVSHVFVIENQTQAGEKHRPTAATVLLDARLLHQTDGRLTHIGAPSSGLYEVWNLGMRLTNLDGQNRAGRSISVILNDDVQISAETITAMVQCLQQNPQIGIVGADYQNSMRMIKPQPQRVFGSYRKGGIGGFAFAVDASIAQVDENFQWWGGDDDLIAQVMAAGFEAHVLIGAPVFHPLPETSAVLFPELARAKGEDRDYHLAKYGETW